MDELIKEIVKEGSVSFARFMQLALYAPGVGYYSSGQQKFGRDGDFITAPELSPLFSQCIAKQCQQVLSQLESPVILEFGAGSGVMAADILLALETLNCLPAHYFILELSAELQSRQRETMKARAPHLLDKVQWLSTLPSETFEGVVLANEVLDAMPVNKFRTHEGKLQEAHVGFENEQFVWQWQEASNTLEKSVQRLEIDFPDAYESEINLFIHGWVRSISSVLSRGLVLLIDYGFPRHEYYHSDRHMGTIMCHYQHRSHSDPLMLVGRQDITAHVDFTAVAEAGIDNDFDVEGFTNQAAFLIDCGITDLLQTAKDEVEQFNWNSQVKQLTLPSEMGELFKVIALTKDFDEVLLGFRRLNLLERL